MAILVLNCGSSSTKISLFEHEKLVASRNFDKKTSIEDALSSMAEGRQIAAVGHRFVHGGPNYTSSVVVDDRVLRDLEGLSSLAPLHNPTCLEGIKAASKLLGNKIPQVVVFDTAFHRTMPPRARFYGIDTKVAEQLFIQRYGFHGIAHAYLWNTTKQSKVITVHLGNGCSMAAIKDGQSVDTSMGFTPAEGLLMATRAGDIDSGAVEYLCREQKQTVQDVLETLNKRSGLIGVSGLSSDMRELLAHERTHDGARLAIDLFCYRVIKYIGAYCAVLQGVDALFFSGGIGENSTVIRQRVVASLGWLGASLDVVANENAINLELGQIERISAKQSEVDILVVGVDENRSIAQEVIKLV